MLQLVPSLAIHDTMKHVQSEVATVGFGACMGMPGFLLATGQKVRFLGFCRYKNVQAVPHQVAVVAVYRNGHDMFPSEMVQHPCQHRTALMMLAPTSSRDRRPPTPSRLSQQCSKEHGIGCTMFGSYVTLLCFAPL